MTTTPAASAPAISKLASASAASVTEPASGLTSKRARQPSTPSQVMRVENLHLGNERPRRDQVIRHARTVRRQIGGGSGDRQKLSKSVVAILEAATERTQAHRQRIGGKPHGAAVFRLEPAAEQQRGITDGAAREPRTRRRFEYLEARSIPFESAARTRLRHRRRSGLHGQQGLEAGQLEHRLDRLGRIAHGKRAVDLLQLLVELQQDADADRAHVGHIRHVEVDAMGPVAHALVQRGGEVVGPVRVETAVDLHFEYVACDALGDIHPYRPSLRSRRVTRCARWPITSSARARSAGGTVRPNDRAASRLTMIFIVRSG